MELEKLIYMLEVSAERNGKDKVLTIGHLLNILKLMSKIEELEEISCQSQIDKHEFLYK